MIRKRIALVSSCVLTALAGATFGASASAAPVTLEGTYQRLAADARPGFRAAHDREVVVDRRGRGTDVTLAKGMRLVPGAKVRLTGRRSASTFDAGAATVVAAAPKTTAPAPTVTVAGTSAQLATTPVARQRVLVILASWTTPDTVSREAAQRLFHGDADTWFTQTSHGALGMTGDVTPWLTVAGPDGGLCWANMFQLMTQAKAAALAGGFDAATYDRTVLYFPAAPAGSDCYPYAGWATLPGSDVWLNGTMSLRTAVHEQGHNLGLGHAFSWTCTAGGVRVPLSATCAAGEYGDPLDAMGGSSYVGFFSAPAMVRRGWLSAGRITDLSAGGAVTLQPLEGTGGVVAATVVAGSRTYWLEYRTGAGMDAGVPLGSRGLVVRVTDGTRPEAGLLDLSPADGVFDAAALRGSWVTPEGLTITAGTDGGGGLPVTVTRAAVPGAPGSLGLRLQGAKLTVSWTAPVSDGGAPLTGYVVEVGATRTVVGASSLSWSVGTLASGSYAPRVWATNQVGAGPAVSGLISKR